MNKIKRSVSLYSFQDAYARGKVNLEEIFEFLKNIGVEGFEYISDQMMHNTPFPKEEDLEKWDRLMVKYKIKPVCNDIFINTKLYKNRVLTTKEATDALINEIKLANRLGFKLVRLVSMTPPEIVEPALPYAEKYDVTLALEVHGGMSFDHPMTKAFVDVMKNLNSPYVGLVLDLGIFCRRHPRISKEYFRYLGLSKEVADYIDNIFTRGLDPKRVFKNNSFVQGGSNQATDIIFPEELKRLFKNPIDEEYATLSTGYENSDLNILDEFMPFVKHIHGKFYEMLDNGEEYSIPYGDIIKYLDEKGYDGYISSEYEGQRFTLPDQPIDDFGAVKKHQAMLKRYIDSLN